MKDYKEYVLDEIYFHVDDHFLIFCLKHYY